jgi:subtilisin family serine protease
MKKLYSSSFVVISLLCFVGQGVAQEALPKSKRKCFKSKTEVSETSSTQNENQKEVPELKTRPEQTGGNQNNVIPVADQIHSEVRWYALENANNDQYWENVNTERIWIELEVGRSINEPQIRTLIEQYGLGTAIRTSMHPYLTNYHLFEKAGTTREQILDMVRDAQEIDGILFLEPSVIYKGSYVPNDPMWNQQWGPYAIYADVAWDYGVGGNSWNVLGVVDDAVDWLHQDLFDMVWYGYDYGFMDGNPTPDGSEQNHGTHVTGTMSAKINNGVGIAGMVNDTVYFAKVTDNTYFTQNGAYSDAAIIDAMYDMAEIDRITVINLSLGGGAPSFASESAYNYAWNNGKLPIVASGNESMSAVSYPAAYPACMAVGALGTSGNNIYLAPYSNYGDQQEVSAPGGDTGTGFGIVSTLLNNTYGPFQGTSMACPHVAGLAGLMKNLNPNLTNVDIRNIINATCFDLGPNGWDVQFGYGMVNAQGAVEVAVGATNIAETIVEGKLNLYPNPANQQIWIHLENELTNANIQVFNASGALVQQHNAGSVALTPVDVSALSNGVYMVQVKTDGGLFTGRFVKSM